MPVNFEHNRVAKALPEYNATMINNHKVATYVYSYTVQYVADKFVCIYIYISLGTLVPNSRD